VSQDAGQVVGKLASRNGGKRDRCATNPKVQPVRCMDVAALGAYMGVKRRTIWRLVASGTLKPIRLPGLRKVLFDVADVDRILNAAKD